MRPPKNCVTVISDQYIDTFDPFCTKNHGDNFFGYIVPLGITLGQDTERP